MIHRNLVIEIRVRTAAEGGQTDPSRSAPVA
jgi:hypothetical protein